MKLKMKHTIKKNLQKSLAFVFLTSSLNVYAAPNVIEKVGGWILYENIEDSQTVCTIESDDKVAGAFGSSELTTVFRVSKVKNSPLAAPELYMELVKNSKNNTSTYARLDRNNLEYYIAFPDITGTRKLFWGIPIKLNTFLETLIEVSELRTRAIGGSDKSKSVIPAKGFGTILKTMEAHCNNNRPLVSTEFDQIMTQDLNVDINSPSKYDLTKSTDLRTSYREAFKAHMEIEETNKKLNEVIESNRRLIVKLNDTESEIKKVQTVDLPRENRNLNQAKMRQSEAKASLEEIERKIPGLRAKIESSQNALKNVEDILNPLVPRQRDLTSRLQSAQRNLSSAENALNQLERRYSEVVNNINALNREGQNISQMKPQKEMDEKIARDELMQLQSRLSNFNFATETNNRLFNTAEYRQQLQNRQNLAVELERTQQNVQEKSRMRTRAARRLEQCKNPGSQPELTRGPSAAEQQLPPGTVPVKPNEGLKPGPGPRPAPAPAPAPTPDCSALERELEFANSQMEQAQNIHHVTSSRLNEVNLRIAQIENYVENEVRRYHNDLVNRELQARNRYESILASIRNDDRRLIEIYQNLIPNLSAEQARLESQRPALRSQISQSANEVAASAQALAEYESSVNWNSKVEAVNSANRQLDSDVSNLNVVLVQKDTETNKLNSNISLATQAQVNIETYTALNANLNSRAASLREAINKLPEQTIPLESKISMLKQTFESFKIKFASLLK